MYEDRNQYQIIRKDARNCFVESLSDAFNIGKAHFAFATYDLSQPVGQRQTNNIHIYMDISELLELCRKMSSGEMRFLIQQKKKRMTGHLCSNGWEEHPQINCGKAVALGQMEKACPGQHSCFAGTKQISFLLQIAVREKQTPKG